MLLSTVQRSACPGALAERFWSIDDGIWTMSSVDGILLLHLSLCSLDVLIGSTGALSKSSMFTICLNDRPDIDLTLTDMPHGTGYHSSWITCRSLGSWAVAGTSREHLVGCGSLLSIRVPSSPSMPWRWWVVGDLLLCSFVHRCIVEMSVDIVQ